MIRRYQEKLIEVYAIMFNGSEESIKEICEFCKAGIFGYLETNKTLTGVVLNIDDERYLHVSMGDYVTQNDAGHIDVIKGDLFRLKFRAIDDI